MAEKNETPNETEPVELIEPTEADAVVIDDAETDAAVSDTASLEAALADDAVVDDAVVVEAVADDAAVDDAAVGEAAIVDAVVIDDSVGEPVVIDDAVVEVVPATAREVQTVYITAPVPPKKRGNRGIGALLAIVAAIVFAALYLGVSALLIFLAQPDGAAAAIVTFTTSALFYVPALAFLVLMILWVFLVNRAAWSAWVLGSLLIAVAVYAASIGVLLLMDGGVALTAAEANATTLRLATNPVLIAAALISREVSIWFGAAIAARGRKVRERNAAAHEAFEREEAEKRNGLGGATA